MSLRGFDTYEVTLGDEMRGERASLGKSLEEAERDLRLKASVIEAIENCDLSGFPNQSVVSGYVKSYARYLGMDAEACYDRFCEQSGFRSPVAMFGQSQLARGGDNRGAGGLNSGAGAEIGHSRFAAPPTQSKLRARISLGTLTSSAALLALIGALSYGGYALLKDIQRVGFAPLPSAPTVVANAPEIAAPEIEATAMERPSADAYSGGGMLAAAAAPAQLPPIAGPARDGPISAIDPDSVGLFPDRTPPRQPTVRANNDALAPAGDIATSPPTPATEQAPVETGVALHAAEDAWIRVRESSGQSVIFEGILGAGQRFELPERVAAPVLKAGNAGGLYVVVDGVVYGPVGARGQVARNVSLSADDIRTQMPKAEEAVVLPGPGDTLKRAEADLATQ